MRSDWKRTPVAAGCLYMLRYCGVPPKRRGTGLRRSAERRHPGSPAIRTPSTGVSSRKAIKLYQRQRELSARWNSMQSGKPVVSRRRRSIRASLALMASKSTLKQRSGALGRLMRDLSFDLPCCQGHFRDAEEVARACRDRMVVRHRALTRSPETLIYPDGAIFLERPCPTNPAECGAIGQFCMGRKFSVSTAARPWRTTPKNLAGLWLSFFF